MLDHQRNNGKEYTMDEQEQFSISLPPFQKSVAKQRFRGLVVVGSNQPITAALLIAALAPERVAFLLTNATQDMPDRVAALLHCAHDGWVCPTGDYASVTNVYQGLRNVLLLWSDVARPEIAVDVTAGMKQMSIGLAQAAHLERLTTVYVRSEYDRAANRVKPGSQEFEIIPDPYTVFGDLEAAEARRLFTAHDYVGANRIFNGLAERVAGEAGTMYRTFAQLADAYAAWDAFDLAQAERALNDVLDGTDLTIIQQFLDQLRAQQHALPQLNNVVRQVAGRAEDALRTLADIDAVLPLIGSLHANALRRQAQRRYDTAALLRYRCLELMSQHRLATHGILTERPRYHQARRAVPGLEERYRDVQRRNGRRNIYDLPERGIGLFVGYMLLAALDDALVRGYTIGRIEERTQARNKSILAHGYRLITEQEYTLFCEVVEELINRFFAVSGRDHGAWECTYAFVQPFVEAHQ